MSEELFFFILNPLWNYSFVEYDKIHLLKEEIKRDIPRMSPTFYDCIKQTKSLCEIAIKSTYPALHW